MKENIETKDVQRAEYLDKNGLDMLWAKVKENTHNQVEVERNRATTQENRIIETKADKSELHSSYVSNSTFTALQEKVAANTDAISDKQDAGNYLSYKTINNEGYYEIPDIRIPGSGGITKTDIDSQSISVNCDYPASHTTITCDGISNADNNANHVYATDGSIADLTQYAKKSEISASGNVDDIQVNGVSVVENKIANIKPATKESLGAVKVGDGLNVADGTISVDGTALEALKQKVTANTTAISSKQDAGKYIPYEEFQDSNTYVLPDNQKIKLRVDYGEGIYSSSKITAQGIYVNNPSGKYTDIGAGNIRVDSGGHASNDRYLSLTPDNIAIFDKRDSERLLLDCNGIRLEGGDNNHVLTSNRSTIDITQYVLKSVYDKKIAALEARIAALEAKHAETA